MLPFFLSAKVVVDKWTSVRISMKMQVSARPHIPEFRSTGPKEPNRPARGWASNFCMKHLLEPGHPHLPGLTPLLTTPVRLVGACSSPIYRGSLRPGVGAAWLDAKIDPVGELPKNDERSDVESVGARFIAPEGWGEANAPNSPTGSKSDGHPARLHQH